MFIKPIFYFDTDEGSGGTQPGPDSSQQPQTPPAPPAPPVDWEKRYKGLQTHANGLQTQINNTTTQHSQVVADYEGKLSTVTAERDTARTTQASLEQTRDKLQQDNLRLQKQLTVMQRIHDPEHPELQSLAPFFAKGLLAVGDLDGEALDQYLKDYADTLGQQLQGQIRSSVSGGSPPSAPGARNSAGKTADEYYDELAKMDTTDPNYTTTYQAYLAQREREKKK